MNIRSIIGLTALAPYIIGSTLLISTACAPKSRHRSPVNIAGVGPVQNPADKVLSDNKTLDRIQEIQDDFNKNPEHKVEAEKLNGQISEFEIVKLSKEETEIMLTVKNDQSEDNIMFSGSASKDKESELTVIAGPDSLIKVSVQCENEECSEAAINIKNEKTMIELQVRRGSTVAAVEIPVPAQSDDEKAIASKLEQIKDVQITQVLSKTLNKEQIKLAIRQDLEDQSQIKMTLEGAAEAGSALQIKNNEGLEKIIQATVVSLAKGDNSAFNDKEISINLQTEGETPFIANLRVGPVANTILAKRAEAKKKSEDEAKKQEEDKALADAQSTEPEVAPATEEETPVAETSTEPSAEDESTVAAESSTEAAPSKTEAKTVEAPTAQPTTAKKPVRNVIHNDKNPYANPLFPQNNDI